MPIFETFSKRRRAAEKAGQADVYQYDELPEPFRVQVIQILDDAMGNVYDDEVKERWKLIHNAVARERGLFRLGSDYDQLHEGCKKWLLSSELEPALDLVEIAFRVVDRFCSTLSDNQRRQEGITQSASNAINELNHRFREHAVGFQYENGMIIQLDSQYVHTAIVKPAIALLSGNLFAAANDEFMTAHRWYREAGYKECIVAANRAFESVLKAICTARRWHFESGARAGDLLTVVRKNNLFPDYLGKGFDSYVAAIKSGLPEVRNNAGGHGDEPNAPKVSEHVAAYALHLTAANILLMVQSYNDL